MELRQLRYLERVVATGGFRSAARELGIAEPTLSVQIKQLERDLGLQLLDRATRPIRPTPAGEAIVAQARLLLAGAHRLGAEVAQLQRQTRRLILGTHQCVNEVLPLLIEGFSTSHPDIDVRLVEPPSSNAARMVLDGELDASVVALRTAAERLPDELRALRLFSFEYVFAVPASHRLAYQETVNLADMADERFVLSSGTSGTMLKETFGAAGITPHIALETNDADMLTSLVERGLGVGFAPDFKVARAHPGLHIFKLTDLTVADDAMLTWHAGRGAEPILAAFLSYVRSRRWDLDALPAWSERER